MRLKAPRVGAALRLFFQGHTFARRQEVGSAEMGRGPTRHILRKDAPAVASLTGAKGLPQTKKGANSAMAAGVNMM